MKILPKTQKVLCNQDQDERAAFSLSLPKDNLPKECIVGVSGGLDSTVGLLGLKERGVRVQALLLKLQDTPFPIPDTSHIQAIEELCEREHIPFRIIDVSEVFQKRIIDYFVKTYAEGKTPCPCVLCNQHIKVPLLIKAAQEAHIAYVATGHYAQIISLPHGSLRIARAQDTAKDQSYFLSRLTEAEISHLYLPLSYEKKATLQAAAKSIKLKAARAKESTDVCFVSGSDYRSFLKEKIPQAFLEGDFVDKNGAFLGRHAGYGNFTVGQRKGIGLGGGPWYVARIHANSNTVELVRDKRPLVSTFCASKLVVSGGEKEKADLFKKPLYVQTHYRARPVFARLISLNSDTIEVNCSEDTLAAPGQVAAFYEGNMVLGSGIICA